MNSKTANAKISLFKEIQNYIEEGKQQLSFAAHAIRAILIDGMEIDSIRANNRIS